jgi:hypothetical protein
MAAEAKIGDPARPGACVPGGAKWTLIGVWWAGRYHRMFVGQYMVGFRQHTARQARLSVVISIDPAAKFIKYPGS